MKIRQFAVFSIFLLTSVSFAHRFQIEKVEYEIHGSTKQYALEQKIKIDRNRIFENEDEFLLYFNDLRQRFYNERNFENSELDFSYSNPDEKDLCCVTITAKTIDSSNFLIVPYPKYNSNNGAGFKLKTKNSNFLGTLEELTADLSFQIKKDDEKDETKRIFGASIDFELPFPFGPFEAKWLNNWAASYTIGKDAPEYDFSTGFFISLPFNQFALEWTIKQNASRNFDYEDYEDELYFTEFAKFDVKITLQDLDELGKVYYIPYTSAIYNWDKDGIQPSNEDLSSPIYRFGHALSAGRYNWHGNFRNGAELVFDQNIGYNTQTYNIIPFVSGEAKIFLDLHYLGMCMDAYAFASKNSHTKIGERLRGIKDDQKYATGNPEIDGLYVTRPDSAIVVNMDMPFKIFTFNFDNWKHFHFFKTFNCELQISPFFDFALFRNRATGTNFFYKDGFYAGGLEFLVYPQKWRSLVVRASAGADLGRLFLPDQYINTDWRKDVSKYEIEIGVGLHY